jgi:response regulator RpfG family c-di-GMP phosphodiesterase
MPGNCGACGITFQKKTEVVKCTGKCGMQYHSVCTDWRTQDITMLIQKRIEWFCNFCRSYTSNRKVKNVKVSSMTSRKCQPNISDQIRSLMGEFSELRVCAEELLKKTDELETAFNKINGAKENETDRVVKRVRNYNNETNEHVKNLTLGLSRKTNGLRICNEVTLNTVENLAKALKIHVYFLAFLVLVFVISEIYVC